ncbi:MAG: hypothetical protein Q4D62_04350 [Planctomycetia bacterium]|nr:hypothetical protein [Planctomycetia bacterium]
MFRYISRLMGVALVMGSWLTAEEVKPFRFTTHTQEAAGVRLALDEMDYVTEIGTPFVLTGTLRNSSDEPIRCKVEWFSCDTVKCVTGKETSASRLWSNEEIPAGGEVKLEKRFVLEEGTYSAHYPLHVVVSWEADGATKKVHCVRVIETKVPAVAKTLETTVVRTGGVSLIGKSYTASWKYVDGEENVLGINWRGSEETSRASIDIHPISASGKMRQGISAHPPYRPQGGSIFVTYPVQLPASEEVQLSYGCAIRATSPTEPPSDGVTFRIWGKTEGGERQLLDEIHTDSKTWVDRQVSLASLAGKKVDLTVEFHPGPKNNTTCDGCFVSGLTISAGEGMPPAKSFDAHLSSQRFTFSLEDGFVAHLYPGANGLLDSRIDLGRMEEEKSFVSFNGITLSLGELNLLGQGTLYSKTPQLRWEPKTNRLIFEAEVLRNDAKVPVKMEVYAHQGMLILEIPEGNSPEIRGFSLREANQSAERVYFGHGYVIEKPKEFFRIGHGGHNLAASHVGFDFENGTSLLMATESPLALVVNPQTKVYTLEDSGVTRLALLPSAKGAYAAAMAFRQQSPWKVAPTEGVIRKRGRLTYDVWGGRYDNNLKQLRQAVAYGVDDSLFVKHVWQCWGYDVRLPDIWNTEAENPVLAQLGEFQDLKALAEFCHEQKIPFGLHDNYIDFYPDAEKFSYDYITFHANNTPRRAWVNHGAQVLSYQWRPDLFHPFLMKNMELGRKYLPTMDAYFVDVFSSMNVFDFWTRDGKFHPKAETRKCWKACFETIANELAQTRADGSREKAITISEAAADFLIGSLDGADCQWMLISEQGGAWKMKVPAENWSRSPWFAAVNHTNFSRHGAGYADRYNALRNQNMHGIMSDDYISAEILGGLDLMVNLNTILEGSVRKHYLAQHVRRQLADQEIVSVEFAEGNIRRQCVTWSDATKVYVNRGEGTWQVGESGLPKYGFVVLDKMGKVLSGIVRNPANPAEVVEMSQRNDGSFYLYGRGKAVSEVLPISPVMKRAEISEDRSSFRVAVEWQCREAAPKDLSIFVHVFEPRRGYGFKPMGWYAGGEKPTVPTSQWGKDGRSYLSGESQVLTIPGDMRDGIYHVMVGLFDAAGDGRRYPLVGEDAQDGRYSVAKFQIRNGKIEGNIEPVERTETDEDFLRLLANRTPFAFRGIETLGAVRVTPQEKGLEILPLPVTPNFETFAVTLDENVYGKVTQITCDGQEIPFTRDGNRVTWEAHVKDAKPYRLTPHP